MLLNNWYYSYGYNIYVIQPTIICYIQNTTTMGLTHYIQILSHHIIFVV